MKFLRHLLDIFYPNYNLQQTNLDISQSKKTYKCGISFQLDDKDDINITMLMPEDDQLSLDNMTDIAEKYAQLLLAINKGLLTNQILQILNNRSKTSNEIDEKLFIDNVISFYDTLKKEFSKLQNHSSPLIKPMSVFRIN